MTMGVHVLIADDHAIVRRGLRQLLSQTPEIGEIDEVETARGVLEYLQKQEPGLLLLDISLPDGNGLEFLKNIHEKRPTLPVLVLSMYSEELYAIRVLKAGGYGYLTKGSPAEEIQQAVGKILSGGRYISPGLAERMAFELSGDKWKKLPYENLSDREQEVLRLIAFGKTVSEIAGLLHLSVKTISTHRTHILAKTHLKTTADLIRFGIENKIDG